MSNRAAKIACIVTATMYALVWLRVFIESGANNLGALGCALAAIALYVSIDAWTSVHPDRKELCYRKLANAKHAKQNRMRKWGRRV